MYKGTTCVLEESIIFNIDLETFIECNFTLREIVVSSLMVEGFSIKEIALHQGVSRRYITEVVKDLRSKFRCFISDFSNN